MLELLIDPDLLLSLQNDLLLVVPVPRWVAVRGEKLHFPHIFAHGSKWGSVQPSR